MYISGHSVFHRMDALSKLVWVVILAISTFFLPLKSAFLLFLSLVAVVLLVARLHPLVFLRGSGPFLLIGSTVIVARAIFVESGPTILTLGPIDVTRGGFEVGAFYGLRLMNVAISSLLLLWTSRLKAIVDGLVAVGLPSTFAYTIFVALRFVPVLSEELQIVRDAHRVRGSQGFPLATRFANRWKSYMFTLVINSMRKAEILAAAMDVRGFNTYPKRTTVEEFRVSLSGVVLILVYVLLAAASMIYLR